MERLSKTLLNRKKTLMKKASELSNLCDAKICMLIYNTGNNKPEIWPDNADEVKTLIHNYKQAKENCGGTHRSKKRALDLTDVNVKDNDTSEANKRRRKSAAGSSSSTTVPDLWDGFDVDGLSKDQMFDLLSNLDRKIGGLQNRIDDLDLVAKKQPYQYSSATPPLHMSDLLASSSSSSNEYSFQTTTTYPPGYFQNMMIQSQQGDQLDTSNYPPDYFQNSMIQSDQRLLEDQMMMSTSSSCQFSSFLSDHHQLRGCCCCSDQFSDVAAKLMKYKNIIPLLLESTYQL